MFIRHQMVLMGKKFVKLLGYVGISDKITCFGIFEYNQFLDKLNQGSQLILK